MVTEVIGTAAAGASRILTAARALSPAQRQELSVEVLARTGPLSRLAAGRGVSRKFLYAQGLKAKTALEGAFAVTDDDQAVLYYLPITKSWIRQFVLGLALEGHAGFRGICRLGRDLLDYDLSIGTVHNTLEAAAQQARMINRDQDLAGIRVGAHDEIYQADRPVLVGVDAKSTYCYLLSEAECCDETTWGVHLLDLERQGLHPDYTVADGGTALRAGQAAAWPRAPCHGDVFHAERELGKVAYYLANRAAGCVSARQKLEHKMERSKRHGRGKQLSRKLGLVRQAELEAVALAQDVRLLADWLREDILALAGPDRTTRRELFDFVVRELGRRENLCPYRIGPVRRALAAQRDNLLAFADVLEEEFAALAEQFDVPAFFVQQLCQLEARSTNNPAYWQHRGPLMAKLREKFLPLQQAVRAVMANTTRASSIVENLNSRLRNYFFLRRDLGNGYLDLLRFFLNHHAFQRSRQPQRVMKSPTELLTGRSRPHWLELLGFQRFHQQ